MVAKCGSTSLAMHQARSAGQTNEGIGRPSGAGGSSACSQFSRSSEHERFPLGKVDSRGPVSLETSPSLPHGEVAVRWCRRVLREDGDDYRQLLCLRTLVLRNVGLALTLIRVRRIRNEAQPA
jgi:hypothetical protein